VISYFCSRIIVPVVAIAAAVTLAGNSAWAGFLPYGLQGDVSQATVDSWGWTEIHRSAASQATSESDILSAADGDYLMMGVWDKIAGQYAILGAGASSVVKAITYTDFTSDNGGTTLNNYSNGLNFYRTQTVGAWGFTTNNKTELNSTDVLLFDGLQNQNGQVESVLSMGLSFSDKNGSLTSSTIYNVTGNNVKQVNSNNYERVFFKMSGAAVPEPSTFAMWGMGILGMAVHLRRKRRHPNLNA
jgi:PEP-CTERM motif